mgnify:CR=1 FL=1
MQSAGQMQVKLGQIRVSASSIPVGNAIDVWRMCLRVTFSPPICTCGMDWGMTGRSQKAFFRRAVQVGEVVGAPGGGVLGIRVGCSSKVLHIHLAVQVRRPG